MKRFEIPSLEVEKFDVCDVITTSSSCPTDGVGDNDGDDF